MAVICGGKRAVVAIAEYFWYLGWLRLVNLDFRPDLEGRTSQKGLFGDTA